jgi:hypothetical protein
VRIAIDCDSFWDEYLLGHDEKPPEGALTKTVSVGGEDRAAVRFLRHTPSRTHVRVGGVQESYADYTAAHHAAGQVPDHRDFVHFLCDEHLAKGPLRHHGHHVTGVSVYHDAGEDDAETQQLVGEVQDHLRRKYGVGGVNEDLSREHFHQTSPVLSNAEKREHMLAHYAPEDEPAPPEPAPADTPEDAA